MSPKGKIRFRSSAPFHVKWNSNPEWKFIKRRKGGGGKGFCKDSNFSNFFPQKGALVVYLECTRGFESFWSMSKRGQVLVSTGEKRGLYLLFIIIQVHGKLGVLRWSPNVGFVGKILYSGWTTLAQRRCQNRMSLIHCAYWGTNDVVSWKAIWPRCP